MSTKNGCTHVGRAAETNDRTARLKCFALLAAACLITSGVTGSAIDPTGESRRPRDHGRDKNEPYRSAIAPRPIPPRTAVAGAGAFQGSGGDVIVYDNFGDQSQFFPPGAGVALADDMLLKTGTNERELIVYSSVVFSPMGTPSYDVTTELWSDDGTGSAPKTLIPGTSRTHSGVAPGGIMVVSDSFFAGINLPDRVWMTLTFSTDDAGWLIAEQAESGFTDDFFWRNPPGVITNFQNNVPYSGFSAQIRTGQSPGSGGFNIDLNAPGGSVPPDTSGAVAVQPGVWNDISFLGFPPNNQLLVDLGGNLTSVGIETDVNWQMGSVGAGVTWDPDLMNDHGLFLQQQSTITVTDLPSGTYDIYVYSFSAGGLVEDLSITIGGATKTVQGPGFDPGGQVQGQTFEVFAGVAHPGGNLPILLDRATTSVGLVNGLQITTVPSGPTQQDVADFILRNILGTDPMEDLPVDDVNLWMTETPLDQTSVARHMTPELGDVPFPFERTWLVMIDDFPDANFGHPVRWVFVEEDPATRQIVGFATPIIETDYPPTVFADNGVGPEVPFGCAEVTTLPCANSSAPPQGVGANPHLLNLQPPTAQDQKCLHAILISGGIRRGWCRDTKLCSGGANNDKVCASNADCPGGACNGLCWGGNNRGQPCQTDANCPGARCGGRKPCDSQEDCPGQNEICKHSANNDNYKTNLVSVYKQLRACGYPADQINTFYADGKFIDLDDDNSDNDPRTGSTSEVTGGATRGDSRDTSAMPPIPGSGIRGAISTACQTLDADEDVLFIYVTNHGVHKRCLDAANRKHAPCASNADCPGQTCVGHDGIALWAGANRTLEDFEVYTPKQFFEDTKDCQVCRLFVVMDQCYSGLFAVPGDPNDPISKPGVRDGNHKNMVVHTSAPKDTPAHGRHYMDNWEDKNATETDINCMHAHAKQEMDEIRNECRKCVGGENKNMKCKINADCPQGTCEQLGHCKGGTRDGKLCFVDNRNFVSYNCPDPPNPQPAPCVPLGKVCVRGPRHARVCMNDADCTPDGACSKPRATSKPQSAEGTEGNGDVSICWCWGAPEEEVTDCVFSPDGQADFGPGIWTHDDNLGDGNPGVPIGKTFRNRVQPPADVPTYETRVLPGEPNDWHWDVRFRWNGTDRVLKVWIENFGPEDDIDVPIVCCGDRVETMLKVNVGEGTYKITDQNDKEIHTGQWSEYPGDIPENVCAPTGDLRETIAATGACCLGDGTCVDTTAEDCENNMAGLPQGSGTTCAETMCPVPEACCSSFFTNDGCANAFPDDCVASPFFGIPQGPETACLPGCILGGRVQACCLPEGGCVEIDPVCCDEAGGVPAGPTVCPEDPPACGDQNGNGVADACEVPPCTTNEDCAIAPQATFCTFDSCEGGTCTFTTGKFGDVASVGGICGPDGGVDLFDIIAVLDGFAGVFRAPCTRGNIDICGQEGLCEPNGGPIALPDIICVLDAFSGAGPCVPICNVGGPAVEAPPVRRSAQRRSRHAPTASFTLVPTVHAARGGDLIEVEVFVSGASDVRGYELAVEADALPGGRRVRLELVDVSIDTTRADYLLGGVESVTAVDATAGRLAAAAYTGGVPISGDAYVGTFTFRAASDATGTFRFNVRVDSTAMLDRMGEPMAIELSSASISVGPPTDGRDGSKPIHRGRR